MCIRDRSGSDYNENVRADLCNTFLRIFCTASSKGVQDIFLIDVFQKSAYFTIRVYHYRYLFKFPVILFWVKNLYAKGILATHGCMNAYLFPSLFCLVLCAVFVWLAVRRMWAGNRS